MTLITDLTFDDFQFVFKYLDFSDLINLSVTNRYLQNIIKLYLDDEFKRKIVLQCSSTTDLAYGKKIIIVNFRSILRFIRIFGNQIKILLFWVVDRRKCEILALYLNSYCSNLETLLFRSLKFDISPFLQCDFSIRNLLFEFSNLYPSFSQFSTLFPNLINLCLFHTKISDIDLINIKCLKLVVIDNLNMPLLQSKSLIEYKLLGKWSDYLIERKRFIEY